MKDRSTAGGRLADWPVGNQTVRPQRPDRCWHHHSSFATKVPQSSPAMTRSDHYRHPHVRESVGGSASRRPRAVRGAFGVCSRNAWSDPPGADTASRVVPVGTTPCRCRGQDHRPAVRRADRPRPRRAGTTRRSRRCIGRCVPGGAQPNDGVHERGRPPGIVDPGADLMRGTDMVRGDGSHEVGEVADVRVSGQDLCLALEEPADIDVSSAVRPPARESRQRPGGRGIIGEGPRERK